jgi:hypothetical protein
LRDQIASPGRLTFTLLLLLAGSVPSPGRTYYVSSSYGADTNSGKLSAAAWQTIAHVNAQALRPGDKILFRRGDLWRETLQPRSSGTAGKYIVFGAYGVGARPVLGGIPGQPHGANIDNNEQSYITYRDLELRGAREGLRLYTLRRGVRGITLEHSVIFTEASAPHGTMSAGVYANVSTGRIEDVVIRHNRFYPYSSGLEHWGVYFVKGVTDFRIEDNSFGPAGEDAICIWHSANGVIARNHGGGNGENTIDVKDSHNIAISNNFAENDQEYNIVVHSVDAGRRTYNVVIERNRCRHGGQGGKLTAGIALLFVEKTTVSENIVEEPYREGIYVKDQEPGSGNTVFHNRIGKGKGSAIVLEQAPGTRALNNITFTYPNQ